MSKGYKSSMYISMAVKVHSKLFNAKPLLVELDVIKGEIGDRMNIFYVRLNKTVCNPVEMLFEKFFLSMAFFILLSLHVSNIKKFSFCNHTAEAHSSLLWFY